MIRKAIYTDSDERDLIKKGEVWNFHEENTQAFLHNLHPYPAKYIPQIPHKAITEFTNEGDVVYDPFCGCGTTLLEASRLNRNAVGTDNNAIAIMVSQAKTKIYKDKDIKKLEKFHSALLSDLKDYPSRPDLLTDDKNFYYWYDPQIIEHLSKIKGIILESDKSIKLLLFAVFSSILVRSSFQDSDTRYAKIDRDVSIDKVNQLFLSKVARVIGDLVDSKYDLRGDISVLKCDARSVPHIDSESIDLIVTSPPYLNAYDYHKYHRQRLHWVDADIKFTRTSEIGSHDQFTRKNAVPDPYFSDMDDCFSEWRRVLKAKAKCIIIIGDAIVSKEPVKVADIFVSQMRNLGFTLYDRSIRELKPTSRSFNIRNSRITFEHVLIFEK